MVSLIIKYLSKKNCKSTVQTRSLYGLVCSGMGIFFNLILFVSKLLAGIYSGLLSVTADAFNNLSDAASSLASLLGFFWAGKKADSEHPFGHGRVEYIAGIVISASMLSVGAELLKASVGKIIHPEPSSVNVLTAAILVISVCVKLYMAYYNRACAEAIHSQTLMAAAKDSLSDSAATGAVLLSAIIMRFTSLNADGYMGAAMSILILWTGMRSMLNTASPLIGNAPDKLFVEKLEKIVRENPDALDIHDLIVHDYGPDRIYVSLHMEVDGTKDLFALHNSLDLTERRIADELGCEAIIHMDPVDVQNEERKELLIKVRQIVSNIDSSITVHDFRTIHEENTIKIMFDMLMQPSLYQKHREIISETEKEIKKLNENYRVFIKADISYMEEENARKSKN